MKPRLLIVLIVALSLNIVGCATERTGAGTRSPAEGAGTSGAQGSDRNGEKPEIVLPDPNSGGVVDPAPSHGSRGLDSPSPDVQPPGQPGPMTI